MNCEVGKNRTKNPKDKVNNRDNNGKTRGGNRNDKGNGKGGNGNRKPKNPCGIPGNESHDFKDCIYNPKSANFKGEVRKPSDYDKDGNFKGNRKK